MTVLTILCIACFTINPLVLTGLLEPGYYLPLAIIAWAIFGRSKNYGRVLIFLSVALLLVGGGVGPPIIGILAGVAGTGVDKPLTWWRKHLSLNVRHLFTTLWPWIFGIAVINGVLLVIGSLILVYFFDLNNPDLFLNSFFFSVFSLLLTIFIGRAYDVQMS